MTQLGSPALTPPPPTSDAGLRRVLGATAGATFLAFLDATVVNLAMPDLARDFAPVSLGELSWVITAYAVAFAALLGPAGRIADVLGRRRVLLAGIALFTASSALMALAPDLVALALLRAVQGAAAAAMLPAALGLVLVAAPPERRAAAVAVWGAAGGLAAAVGPTVGGIAVEWFDWRAVFLLNVPLGIGLLLLGIRGLPADADVRRDRPLPHLAGTLALVAGLALVVLALTESADWGWSSSRTWGSAVAGVLLVGAALRASVSHPAPAVEVALWRNRTFAAANAASALLGAALFAWLLLGVLFLTQVWGYSALRAGFAMTPGALAAAVGAVLAGRATSLESQRAVAAAAGLAWGLTAGVMVLVLGEEPAFLSVWLPAAAVSGAAVGAALPALTTAATASLLPTQVASGVGLVLTGRQVGGAVGVAALALVVDAVPDDPLRALLLVYALVGSLAALSAVPALALSKGSRR